MATATATKRASTKTAAKSATKATTTRTVRKSAAKKAAADETATKTSAKAPAKKAAATKTVKKTVAKKTVAKKTVAKRAAAKQGANATKAATKAPRRGPVLLDGEPAHNRHFMLTREYYYRAIAKCDADGLNLSDVLRHGIDNYGAKAPTAEKAAGGRRLPKTALNEMKRLYKSDSAMLTEYLAACHRAGWPLQTLADGLVESGAVTKISRQAVSLRVLRAPETLSASLPNVPALGPRRTIASPRRGLRQDQFAKAGASARKEREASTYDFAFRVKDEAYEKANRRAKYEGAMMSGVMDRVLMNFLDGKYDKALAKVARAKSA